MRRAGQPLTSHSVFNFDESIFARRDVPPYRPLSEVLTSGALHTSPHSLALFIPSCNAKAHIASVLQEHINHEVAISYMPGKSIPALNRISHCRPCPGWECRRRPFLP